MFFSARSALLLLLSFQCLAAENVPERGIEHFAIKPLACVVQNAGDVCTMMINVRWQATAPITGCLYQGQQSLYCWQDKISGQKMVEISLNNNMLFSLQNEQQQVLASQKIWVNTALPKQFRRRLRADWSVF